MVLLSQMLGVVLLILEFGGLVCHFERWAHFQPPSHTCVCENPEWPRLRVILQERLLMSHPQGRHRHSLAPGSRFQELCRLPRAEESPRPLLTYSVISVQIGRVFYWYPFQWMLSLLVSRQGGRVKGGAFNISALLFASLRFFSPDTHTHIYIYSHTCTYTSIHIWMFALHPNFWFLQTVLKIILYFNFPSLCLLSDFGYYEYSVSTYCSNQEDVLNLECL